MVLIDGNELSHYDINGEKLTLVLLLRIRLDLAYMWRWRQRKSESHSTQSSHETIRRWDVPLRIIWFGFIYILCGIRLLLEETNEQKLWYSHEIFNQFSVRTLQKPTSFAAPNGLSIYYIRDQGASVSNVLQFKKFSTSLPSSYHRLYYKTEAWRWFRIFWIFSGLINPFHFDWALMNHIE